MHPYGWVRKMSVLYQWDPSDKDILFPLSSYEYLGRGNMYYNQGVTFLARSLGLPPVGT